MPGGRGWQGDGGRRCRREPVGRGGRCTGGTGGAGAGWSGWAVYWWYGWGGSRPVGVGVLRGCPGSPLSFRCGPPCKGRSFVASLRDGPCGPPLTGRPAPECQQAAGKPPGEWPGGSVRHEGSSESSLSRPRDPFRPTGISRPVDGEPGALPCTKRRPEHHPETEAPQIATQPGILQRPAAVRGRAARQIATGAPSVRRLTAAWMAGGRRQGGGSRPAARRRYMRSMERAGVLRTPRWPSAVGVGGVRSDWSCFAAQDGGRPPNRAGACAVAGGASRPKAGGRPPRDRGPQGFGALCCPGPQKAAGGRAPGAGKAGGRC
ncbi:hypothetical protein SUDANB120_05035 [Streptomyces sp. enrichment culture]